MLINCMVNSGPIDLILISLEANSMNTPGLSHYLNTHFGHGKSVKLCFVFVYSRNNNSILLEVVFEHFSGATMRFEMNAIFKSLYLHWIVIKQIQMWKYNYALHLLYWHQESNFNFTWGHRCTLLAPLWDL